MRGSSDLACRFGVGAVVMALALVGCKGSQPAAASAATGGTRVEYINDPSLNMNAIAVTIPANWQFQSVFLQGGTCAPTPFGVFRATRQDGMAMVERMPNLAWAWGQGPMIGYMAKNDCLPMNGPMSAQEFLKYMAATMQVHYDGDAPVPAAEEAKAQKAISDAQATYAGQYAAIHAQQPKTVRQLARAAVSFTKHGTPMKGVLDVILDCTETQYAGQQGLSNWSPGHPTQVVTGQASVVDKCIASVTYYAAPANQIAALLQQWDAPGMGTKPVDAWVQAWIAQSNEDSRDRIRRMNEIAADKRAMLAQQFQHSMAVQQQQHDQFMQTMHEGFEHFQEGVQANWAARDASTSDWVDFALDRQTVLNTNTGQIYKISNQYTPNFPEEQKMHGNGTPW